MSPLTYSISLNFLKTRIREVVTKIPKTCIRKLKTWPQGSKRFPHQVLFQIIFKCSSAELPPNWCSLLFFQNSETFSQVVPLPCRYVWNLLLLHSLLLFCFTGTFVAAH